MYGTTKVEADANETKSWFSNVRMTTAENATLRIEAKDLMKNVAAATSVDNPRNKDQRDRVRTQMLGYRDAIKDGKTLPGPPLDIRTVPYAPKPDNLEKNARVIKTRKRQRVLDSDEEEEWEWMGAAGASQTKGGGPMKMKK